MHTKKKKFKPVITRVKLNPEQAVLTCNCYNTGKAFGGFTTFGATCGTKPSSSFGYNLGSSTSGS